MLVLKRCFDGFADEEGAIPADNVGSILSMMGMKVKPSALRYMSSYCLFQLGPARGLCNWHEGQAQRPQV